MSQPKPANDRRAQPLDRLLDLVGPYIIPYNNEWGKIPPGREGKGWPGVSIDQARYDAAPIIITIDFERLAGDKAKLEVPMNYGSEYLGDMVAPSEMGVCAFDLRWLFKKSGPNNSSYTHKMAPGQGGKDWLASEKMFKCQHYANVDTLATDLRQVGPQQWARKLNSERAPDSFVFGETKFRRTKDFPQAFDQLVQGYHKTHGDQSLRRKIYLLAHAAGLEVAQIDSYKFKNYDHTNHEETLVQFFDMHWRFLEPTVHLIGGEQLAQDLGISHPSIVPHNAGNDAAVTMFCLIRFLVATTDDRNKICEAQKLAPMTPFPRNLQKYQEINKRNINKETETAKKMTSVWNADDIQTALVNEGLMTHEQRTLVQHGGDTHHNLQPKTAQQGGPSGSFAGAPAPGLTQTPAQITGEAYGPESYEDGYKMNALASQGKGKGKGYQGWSR